MPKPIARGPMARILVTEEIAEGGLDRLRAAAPRLGRQRLREQASHSPGRALLGRRHRARAGDGDRHLAVPRHLDHHELSGQEGEPLPLDWIDHPDVEELLRVGEPDDVGDLRLQRLVDVLQPSPTLLGGFLCDCERGLLYNNGAKYNH